MFTHIYKKAATLCLLLIFISIIACGICMVSAEELPYLDLENNPDVVLTYEEIADKQGIILNKAAIEPNLMVLKQYIENTNGNIVIPNRAPGSVLGWTLSSISEESYTLAPFFLYNADVDKNQIDYMDELVSLSSTSVDAADDFMSARASFSVYGKHWLTGLKKVATVTVRSNIDFYDVNSSYDFYLARFEVHVAPESSNSLNSFKVALITTTENSTNLSMEYLMTNSTPADEISSVVIGSEYTYNASDGSGFSTTVSFNYGLSAPDKSVTFNGPTYFDFDDNYIYETYTITPSDGVEKGDSYSALLDVGCRMPSSQRNTGIGVAFFGLSLSGSVFTAGYDQGNADCLQVLNTWSSGFNEKGILVAGGTFSNFDETDNPDEGFSDYLINSSLPNQSVLGPGYWFYD